MTTVTWKSDGPLFLQPAPGSESGLVAIDGDCCCPPPPPPRCWDCLDVCAYFIEVTAPGELAVKSPPYPCSGASTQGSVIVPYMLLDAFPPETDPGDSSPTSGLNNSSATAENYKPYQWLLASAGHNLSGGGIWPTDTGSCGTFATSDFTSVATINCVVKCTPGASSPFTVELSAHVYVTLDNSFQLNNGGSPYCRGWWKWDASVSFPLTSTCQTAPARQCVSTGDEFQVLNTPVSVTADGTTTSLGAYTANASASYGDYASTAQSIGEALRDALAATFRITSRPNCEPEVYCDCAAITNGLTITVQKLGQWYFVWNEEEQTKTYSDLANFYSFTYSPQGPGNEARVVVQQWNLSVTEMYFQWTIDIFCEAIPSGIPSPYRWYGSQLVECLEYASGSVVKRTQKTLLGHFNCEADPCGTNGRSLGDLYPAGAWRDVETFGTVTPDGYEACALPLPIDFRIDNNAECP